MNYRVTRCRLVEEAVVKNGGRISLAELARGLDLTAPDALAVATGADVAIHISGGEIVEDADGFGFTISSSPDKIELLANTLETPEGIV